MNRRPCTRVAAVDNEKYAITFTVEDNGVGIPAAKHHTLFVPFCQPADHKAGLVRVDFRLTRGFEWRLVSNSERRMIKTGFKFAFQIPQ